MSDYKDAFRKGLTAYGQYAAAEKEVRLVLARASEELSAATDGALQLQWATLTRDARPPTLMETVTRSPPPQESYRAITAKVGAKVVELARLDLDDRTGWPATLAYAREHEICSDATALERALIEMLGTQRAGRLLSSIGAALLPDEPAPTQAQEGPGVDGSAEVEKKD